MKSNIPTNTSPIHDLKSSAMVKKLKFSSINDTSSSKLRREVMKHILWTAKFRLPNRILSLLCLLYQYQAQPATYLSFSSSMAPITKRTEKVTAALSQYRYIAPSDEIEC